MKPNPRFDTDPVNRNVRLSGTAQKHETGVGNKTYRFNRIAENRRRHMTNTLPTEKWGLTESADWWSAGQAARQQTYGTATEMYLTRPVSNWAVACLRRGRYW